ncbi:T9SS type A sorting domain-containing protein [Flavobacterium psychraquaticum]|uniref:T9SS type A sorting domain-containing protein n=1 Tax=Flavobacterium psychraquaticum TaxID=3103958 RepID=UPI002ACE81AE|nr:T9SS type A sorting domain-containing protein [Flavobacterium sp. LB-N7T]
MMKKLLSLLLFVPFVTNAQFWTAKATTFGSPSRGVNSISIVDANNVWVKALDGSGGAIETIKEYSKSTDGGNTWTSGAINLGSGTTGLGIGNITAVSASTAWVSAFPATSGAGGIWKTTNGGTTWTKQTSAEFNTPNDSFTNFVHFFDVNNGVCQGDPAGGYFEIYTTSNGGTTWTRVPSVNIPATNSAAEYGYTNFYEVASGTIWFGTATGRLYKSTNMGLNWTVASTPLSDNLFSFSFKDATNGLIVNDSNGAMYKSTDGGATWIPQTYTGTVFTGDLTFIPGTSGVVSTGAATGSSGSSYSTDNGLTWVNVDIVQHLQVEFLNSTIGFTGEFNTSNSAGGISKYTGTVLSTQSFESNGLSIYPNPINNMFTIQNENNIGINSVTIVDINGRTVKNIDVSTIENEINISDLNSGVYFLNITNDKGLATKKIIKN